MAKTTIFFLLCIWMSIVKSQNDESLLQNAAIDTTTLSPEAQALLFKDIASKIVWKQLIAANLPPELQSAGQQVLQDFQNGVSQCEENLKNSHIIWQYKVCATAQLRIAINAIHALQLAALQPTVSAGAA